MTVEILSVKNSSQLVICSVQPKYSLLPSFADNNFLVAFDFLCVLTPGVDCQLSIHAQKETAEQ